MFMRKPVLLSQMISFRGTATYIGRGVRSDAHLSCTENRFQKCSQSGKMVLNTQCY